MERGNWETAPNWEMFYGSLSSIPFSTITWTEMVTFWKDGIRRLCHQRRSVTFTLAELKQGFMRSGRYPKCLFHVIKEMNGSGEALRLEDFARECTTPENISGAMHDLLSSLRQLTLGHSSHLGLDDDQTYTLPSSIKTYAEEMLKRLKSNGKEHTVEGFRRLSKNIMADDTSFSICLVYLLHHHLCAIDPNQKPGQEWVRVGSAEDELREHHGATGQQLDNDIKSFEARGRKLDEEIDKIEEDMKKNRDAATKFIEDHEERRAERVLRSNFDLKLQQDQLSVMSTETREILRNIKAEKLNAERKQIYGEGLRILTSVAGDNNTAKSTANAKLEIGKKIDECQQNQQLLAQTSNVATSKAEEEYIKSEMARMKARPRPPTSGNTDGQVKKDGKDKDRDQTTNVSQGTRKDKKKNDQSKAQDGKMGSQQKKASNVKNDGPEMMEH